MEEDKLNYFVSQVALVSECETWEVIHPFSSTLVQVFQNGIIFLNLNWTAWILNIGFSKTMTGKQLDVKNIWIPNLVNIPKYSHAYSNHIFLEPEKQYLWHRTIRFQNIKNVPIIFFSKSNANQLIISTMLSMIKKTYILI